MSIGIRIKGEIKNSTTYEIAKETLLPQAYGVILEEAEPGSRSACLQLHPSTPPLIITEYNNDLYLDIQTSPAGPGFHDHIVNLFRHIQDKTDTTWSVMDESDYYDTDDFQKLTSQFQDIVLALADRFQSLEPGHSLDFGINPDIIYRAPGDSHTHVGPLTAEEWNNIHRTRQVPDFLFPWQDKGESPLSHMGFARAALTTEFPDRSPANQTEENLYARIHQSLWAAHTAGLTTEIPYQTWLKLLPHVQSTPDEVQAVKDQALANPISEIPLYRTHPLIVFIFDTFKITLPGIALLEWPFANRSFAATTEETSLHVRSINPNVDFQAFANKHQPVVIPDLKFEATSVWSTDRANCLYLLTRQQENAFFITVSSADANGKEAVLSQVQNLQTIRP